MIRRGGTPGRNDAAASCDMSCDVMHPSSQNRSTQDATALRTVDLICADVITPSKSDKRDFVHSKLQSAVSNDNLLCIHVLR